MKYEVRSKDILLGEQGWGSQMFMTYGSYCDSKIREGYCIMNS
jgi:hypothetical protein